MPRIPQPSHESATCTANSAASSSAVDGLSGADLYESQRLLHQYLAFHFGAVEDIVPFACAPRDACDFLPRSARESVKHVPMEQRRRALDMGCAVGRASFELSKDFEEVVGIDFSTQFIEAANEMKRYGEMKFEIQVQGDLVEQHVAHLPADACPAHVHFEQGDACNLPDSIGQFDLVYATNLLCRLPKPRKFLTDMRNVVRKGGILALISPYSWLEEYTTKQEWMGAVVQSGGDAQSSFDAVHAVLSNDFELISREDFPFIIREHERKYQWGVSDGTFWRRKNN